LVYCISPHYLKYLQKSAGRAEERIFATQGDYGEIQCEKGCHPKVYLPDYFYVFKDLDREIYTSLLG